MGKDKDVVHILRQYRHDWLNKIQLIKGNLDLGRTEKVKDLIEDVISQSKNESDLCNLRMDKVASRFLTFNWDNHPYVLSYEIIGGDRDWQAKENIILDLLEPLFSAFDQSAKMGEDNELFIVFKDISEMEVEIDFHGQIINDEHLRKTLTSLQTTFHHVVKEMEWNKEDGFVMTMMFKEQ